MTNGTKWALFASNEQAWEAILEDLSRAEKSIDLEQFIFMNDDMGKKILDICTERAAHGVKIRLLWDAAGSFTFFGSNIASDLRGKGVELRFWKTLIPSYFKVPDYRSWYLRNHRRTLVIDDKVGYTGSICINDKMKNWRDTNVRVDGPIVQEMRYAFEWMWDKANGKNVAPKKHSRGGSARDPEFSYVTNSPAPGRHYLYNRMVEAMRNAQSHIYITTPYFVPTHRIVRVLKLAAHRGVDVRIMIPEKTDHYPALDLAARSFFTSLFQSGIRVFLYTGNVIHSKALVIDGEWATVGSMNMDNASLLYNYEANIISTNEKFVGELTSHFIRDMESSIEVSPSDWQKRFFIEKIPVLLIKVVRKFF